MTRLSKRPDSLHEVSRRVLALEQPFDPAVREFLDAFYSNESGRAVAIAAQPTSIDDIKDAYLSAVAEHLARLYHLTVPEWTDVHGWRLRKPFFAGKMESMKALLTVQSPTAFRRRMLFVSSNALDRPRRHTDSPALPGSIAE